MNFESITFYYKVNELTGGTANCYINCYLISDTDYWAEVFEVNNPAVGSFIAVTKTRAEIMTENGMVESDWGTTPLQLQLGTTVACAGSGSCTFEVFFDDVSYSELGAFRNGDWEEGDMTGWTGSDAGSSGTGQATSISIDGASKRTGSYGAYFCLEAWDATSTAVYTIEQIINLADFSTISLWYKVSSATIPDDPARTFAIQMTYHNSSEDEQTETVVNITPDIGIPPQGWRKIVISKQAFLDIVDSEGGHVHATTKFRIMMSLQSVTTGLKELLIYVDDIVMDDTAAGELTNGNFASGLTGWFPNCAWGTRAVASDAAYTVAAGSGDAVLSAEGNFNDWVVAAISQEMTVDFVDVSFGWELEDTLLDSWCDLVVQFLVYTSAGLPVWVLVYDEWIDPASPTGTTTITKTEVETAMGWDSHVWGTSTAIRIGLYLRPVS
jgi:hypothetical protein